MSYIKKASQMTLSWPIIGNRGDSVELRRLWEKKGGSGEAKPTSCYAYKVIEIKKSQISQMVECNAVHTFVFLMI